MRERVALDLVCLAVLCTILTLGLWPFHAPKNDVAWLAGRNGLRFGGRGTAISSGALEMGNAASRSVEIWLQPERVRGSGTILAFSAPDDLYRFSVHQTEGELALQTAIWIARNRTKTVHLWVEDAFRTARPIFITITSGTSGLAVYIDGVLARRVPQFRIPANQFTGRLVLGDSPGQPDGWKGQLLGLAIYDRELMPPEISEHYEGWTQAGIPEVTDEGKVALYLFDERAGNVVESRGNCGVDLSIPQRYAVLDQILLQPVWTEFSMTWSYWGSALKNIVGFIPFGFCFYARMRLARGAQRAALTTVLSGALASLTIEVLQAYLPTRDSGMTDIITNTLGTWVGVLAFRGIAGRGWLAKLRPWNDARSG